MSGLGNEPGRSGEVSFEVDTLAPEVTIVAPPLSKNTEPGFSGTASEPTQVVVHVLEGAKELASATTTASGGKWSTSSLSKALPTGKHSFTAYATETSGLGNAEGRSGEASFEVDTLPPEVTLAGPPSPSNDQEPGFSGTASEATEVVVHVFEGPTEVASASTTASGGKWSTSGLSKELPSGDRTFTAYATEKSGLGNEAGMSAPVIFEVDTLPPEVTIVAPSSPSNNQEPGFSGTAGEPTQVVVHVFEGATEVASASTTASGGKWSTSSLSKALPAGKHSFTAFATEKSGLGNEAGKSATVPFEVDTLSPEVSIAAPPSPSSNRNPGFSGTASEPTEVVVHVFEGSTEVATASTTASGGKWSTGGLSKELPAGKHGFTAYATEVSGLGNEAGKSATVSFEVDTLAPEVSIGKPPSPSNNMEPGFSGSAGEPTQVTVHVFEGTTEVASASTTASGGKWSTSSLSKALPAGKHSFTAYATEVSGLGNEAGKSATVSFEVDTLAPEVSIVAPPSPSNNRSPGFSGTASEATEVVVHVFEGSTEVASASATASGGKWSTSGLSKELPAGKHSFTAHATEVSGLGNAEGSSGEVPLEVNTLSPEVTLGPTAPSNNRNPGFSGTASEATEVVVHVFEGSTEVASASTTASGGKWSTSGLSKELPAGKHTFTVDATEVSGLGNEPGKSTTLSFEVNTLPPEVTIAGLAPSRNTSPVFSGTASEATEVVVHVFEGPAEVASASTIASGGKWSTGTLSKALPAGKHTFTAYATEVSGLGNEAGKSTSVSFDVNTLAPEVSIVGPTSPSSNRNPGFSGTASEATEVVVHVFEGGTEVASASTTASGGKWSTGGLSKALPAGKHGFTAYATEVSGLGNEAGKSATVPFEVNTLPPEVSITAPSSPSNNRNPGFSGTASEPTQVTVHVFEESTEVASASTTASGGKWSTSSLSKALPAGKHKFTAYATEVSGLGNEAGKSTTVSFEVNTLPPEVTISEPPRSKNTEPAFSGSASESTEVVVHVFEEGTEVASASTTASGGKWSTSSLSKALPTGKHKFTAYATEVSGLGNEAGKSATVSFEVDTLPPEVSIVAPPRSKNTSPGFSGAASESTQVVVHVLEAGVEVASETTTASGEKWSTSAISKVLPVGKHTFTAYAMEVSGLGNAEGRSSEVSFEVDTLPPEVTLGGPAKRSSDKTPNLSGTASETEPVKIEVFQGTKPEGKPVATVVTTVTNHTFSTKVTQTLQQEGPYVAVASEVSSLGNPVGVSSPVQFEVVLKAPIIELTKPLSPSNDTTPSFSGTENESSPVTVYVHEGPTEDGRIVRTVTASVVGGKWTTAQVAELPLESGKGTFTAIAVAESAIKGNPPGESEKQTFVVITGPPTVTLNAPASPSNNRLPSFSGSGSEDDTEVVVHVLEGATEVASATTTVAQGAWSTSGLNKALPEGKHDYSAYATEKSGVGNGPGKSTSVNFEVDTLPPEVTLVGPPPVSSNRGPALSGTASDPLRPVTVDVYSGTNTNAPPLEEVSAEVVGGSWATGRLPTLEWGQYTVIARQQSSLGNATGESEPVTFEAAQIPPAVATDPTTEVKRTSAAFYATVNPKGGPVTSCEFEFGPTSGYGKKVECGFVAGLTAFPPAATGAVEVFARVYGLHPGTTYHVRIVAAGEGGVGQGADWAFATLPEETTGQPAGTPGVPHISVLGWSAQELKPSGKALKIEALLKNRGFSERFKASVPGTAVIDWYYLPRGAKLGGKGKHAPVLVAAGSVTFRSAGTATVKIRLTSAGTRLLRGAKRVPITATGAFTPVGGKAIKATGAFQLTR